MATLKVLDRPYPAKNKEQAQALQKQVSRPQQPRRTALEEEPPPQSPEIEKALLCALLYRPAEAFPMFKQNGTPELFFSKIHRGWFDQMERFYADRGRLDPVEFIQHILDHPDVFDPLGGRVYYVTELQAIFPPTEMIPYYCEDLREKHLRRQILVRSFHNAKIASNGGDVAQLLSKMQRDLQAYNRVSVSNTLSDASVCLNGHMPPIPPEIIHGVLHQGSKMVVGGTSKGRKTMALIDLAVSVATGSDWWGFRTKQGPVCYINFEIQDSFFWFRVDQVCRAKGITIEAGQLLAWNLRGRATAIENLHDEIVSVLSVRPFVLDIIDPIYKALGDRDENRAGDVAGMLNQVERIAVDTGAAIAFGAHYSKGNQSTKEHMDRIGGSGVFSRDPDSIMTMTANEEEDCFTVDATLRNFPPPKPFVVRWDWPIFHRDYEVDPGKLKKVGSPETQFEAKYSVEMLVERLAVQQGTTIKDLKKHCDEDTGMSKATFYRLLQQGLSEGSITQDENKELFRA